MKDDWGIPEQNGFAVIEDDKPSIKAALRNAASDEYEAKIDLMTDIGDVARLLNEGISPKKIKFRHCSTDKTIALSDVLVGHPDGITYDSIRQSLIEKFEDGDSRIKSQDHYFFLFSHSGNMKVTRKKDRILDDVPDKAQFIGENDTRLITKHDLAPQVPHFTLVYATPSLQRRDGFFGRLNLHVVRNVDVLLKGNPTQLSESVANQHRRASRAERKNTL